jgi:hypothetical protein
MNPLLHDILVPTSPIGDVLLETSVGTRFVCAVEGTEFHEVTQFGHALMRVCYVGTAVVSHYVSVPPCARWGVVDGATLVAQKSALVVLVDHYLILFINLKVRMLLLAKMGN